MSRTGRAVAIAYIVAGLLSAIGGGWLIWQGPHCYSLPQHQVYFVMEPYR